MEAKKGRYEMKVAFGAEKRLPLAGFPAGKARVMSRAGEFVRVAIKTKTGIRLYAVEERAGYWRPAFYLGENRREVIK